MASSQYGSLTPLQHYTQGQGQFSTMSFQQMPQQPHPVPHSVPHPHPHPHQHPHQHSHQHQQQHQQQQQQQQQHHHRQHHHHQQHHQHQQQLQHQLQLQHPHSHQQPQPQQQHSAAAAIVTATTNTTNTNNTNNNSTTTSQHISPAVLPPSATTPNGIPPQPTHLPQMQPQLQSQISSQDIISPHLTSTPAPNSNPSTNITPAGTPNLQPQQLQQPQPQQSHPPPPAPKRKGGRPPKRRRTDEDTQPPAEPAPPPPPPTVHPFVRGPYNTLEDAIFSLQLHVFTSGYGVSQKRTVKEKLPSGKYDPEGDIIRKDFACDRGGNEFVSQSRGERRRESRKCGCGWKAAIRRLRRENDRWFVEILEPNHNHPVTPPDEMHTMASYRRWQRENNAGIRSAIARLTRAAAMPARHIAAYLKGDFPDPDLDRIDKQILRALSMNDKETLPPPDKEVSATVFEMVANRPVIILQDSNSGGNSSHLINHSNANNNHGHSHPHMHHHHHHHHQQQQQQQHLNSSSNHNNHNNNAHINGGGATSGMGVLIPTTIGGGGGDGGDGGGGM
ncbi:hypothetical protein F4775DRAFT_325830 [Biscogniauxia sp. FL1348]|nr:hypothetical protein F4775DRAFT_325830 [Biscogniauxia sp. FL1348]